MPQYLANFVLKKEVAWLEETDAGVSLDLLRFDARALARGRAAAPRHARARSRGPWRVVVSHHPIDGVGEGRSCSATRSPRPACRSTSGSRATSTTSRSPSPVDPGPALQAIAGSGSHPTGIKYDVPGRRFFRRSLGYARVDLVPDPAAPGSEELVVSLVAVRPVPAALWQRARVVARYAIAQDGSPRRVFQEDSDTQEAEAEDLEEEPFE